MWFCERVVTRTCVRVCVYMCVYACLCSPVEMLSLFSSCIYNAMIFMLFILKSCELYGYLYKLYTFHNITGKLLNGKMFLSFLFMYSSVLVRDILNI